MPATAIAAIPEPVVLRFKAKLAARPGAAKGGPVVAFPAAIGSQLDGMKNVEGTINGHPFRASLDRTDSGDCYVRVNSAMARGSNASAGDNVVMAILGPEPKLVLAPDLRKAMNASEPAKALWKEMSDLMRRDYVRWVEGTKNPETRARRISRTVEQLAEGKKRPCCFNTYEYPMSYIDPSFLEGFKSKKR